LTPTLTDELQQATLRGVVLPVLLEVLGQGVDALRKECDLDFCRTRVSGVCPVLADDLGLALNR
jgi:hypothetical protein